MSVGVALLHRHSGAPSAECCLRGKQQAAQRRAELGFWLVAMARPEASRSLGGLGVADRRGARRWV
jgi:hypothetical protein